MRKFFTFFLFLSIFLGSSTVALALDIYPPWPCGRRYQITQGTGGSFSHSGQYAWDVGMGVGTELAAVADGVIAFAKGDSNTGCCDPSCSNYANYIVLRMDNGYTAAYWHLAYGGVLKPVGTRVRQGEVIAKSGQTGYSCGAHLHFQVQTNCGRAWCPTVAANWVGFGNPVSGTWITSNNCGCVPSAEVCDGRDNDCDGQVDEGNVCCTKTLDFDICDGVDNDCNGQIDEGDVCAGELMARINAIRFDRTHSDVDGDKKMDYCARSSFGFHCHLSSKGTLEKESILFPLSNELGWHAEHYYQTIRLADINGDGKADLCARGAAGLSCYLSDGNSFTTSVDTKDFSDAGGWSNTRYYSTIRFGDVNGDGKDDLCARWGSDYGCLLSTGTGFGSRFGLGDFGDKQGWAHPKYYGTIQLADINGDGKYDVCARGSGGIVCFPSTGNGFGARILGPAWSDANGWDHQMYWSTIQFGDINGDGKDDLCGRDNAGVVCHLSTGTGFGAAIRATTWANNFGWADISNYSTIQLADVNGDKKMDVCAKADVKVVCVLSEGDKFGAEIEGPPLNDDDKWGEPSHYRSIRFGDYNGDYKADLCARHHSGVVCYPSLGTSFGSMERGATWADEHGWANEQHAFTFRFAGLNYCEPQCSGKDCGSDGCGGSCGTCLSGYLCGEQGLCYDPCVPKCDGKNCGSDSCGGLCGRCSEGEICDAGVCTSGDCKPDCDEKSCGPDNCGSVCGICSGFDYCDNGICKACTPQCEGKVCGPDTCGGTCGSCEGTAHCNAGECQETCQEKEEICDGTDNDCDGLIDEDDVCEKCQYGKDKNGDCIVEIPVPPTVSLSENCACQIHHRASRSLNGTMLLLLASFAGLSLVLRRGVRRREG